MPTDHISTDHRGACCPRSNRRVVDGLLYAVDLDLRAGPTLAKFVDYSRDGIFEFFGGSAKIGAIKIRRVKFDCPLDGNREMLDIVCHE